MTNCSKILALSLFTLAFAFAQSPSDTLSSGEASDASSLESMPLIAEPLPQPPPPPPPPQPSPEPKKNVASGEKTVFDNLRGHAYNPYFIAGAATTIPDLLTVPSDIHGQKFFYVSPSERLGYTAFDLFGGSALLGLDNSENNDLAALVLGYANSVFGIALNYSVSKMWRSDSDNDQSRRTTFPGDNIGLSFSMPFGSASFYANLGWLTYEDSYSHDNDGYKTSYDYSTMQAIVGLVGKFGSLNYDGLAGIIRTGGTYTNDDDEKAVDMSTFTGAVLGLNLSYNALQSSNARVIAGFTSGIVLRIYDEIKNIQESDNMKFAVIAPNILGEVVLFENLLAFAGAMHNITLLGGDMDRNDDTSFLIITHDPETSTFAGIRYQKPHWALEAQVSANPFEALNGNNVFANFGGFIYF